MPMLFIDFSWVLLPLIPSGVTNRLPKPGAPYPAPRWLCRRSAFDARTTTDASGATLSSDRVALTLASVGAAVAE